MLLLQLLQEYPKHKTAMNIATTCIPAAASGNVRQKPADDPSLHICTALGLGLGSSFSDHQASSSPTVTPVSANSAIAMASSSTTAKPALTLDLKQSEPNLCIGIDVNDKPSHALDNSDDFHDQKGDAASIHENSKKHQQYALRSNPKRSRKFFDPDYTLELNGPGSPSAAPTVLQLMPGAASNSVSAEYTPSPAESAPVPVSAPITTAPSPAPVPAPVASPAPTPSVKKTSTFTTGGNDKGGPRACTECGKEFQSWKALFGHMRCHPERQWRGIQPPSGHQPARAAPTSTAKPAAPAAPPNFNVWESAESDNSAGGGNVNTLPQLQDEESDTESIEAAYMNSRENFSQHKYQNRHTYQNSSHHHHQLQKQSPGSTPEQRPVKRRRQRRTSIGQNANYYTNVAMEIDHIHDSVSRHESNSNGSSNPAVNLARADKYHRNVMDVERDMADCLVMLAFAANESNKINHSSKLTVNTTIPAPVIKRRLSEPPEQHKCSNWEGQSKESPHQYKVQQRKKLHNPNIGAAPGSNSNYTNDAAVNSAQKPTMMHYGRDLPAAEAAAGAARVHSQERMSVMKPAGMHNNGGANFVSGAGTGGGASAAMSASANPKFFECSTCKKQFASHQALGGHRASHKKVKGCFARTNPDSQMMEHPDHHGLIQMPEHHGEHDVPNMVHIASPELNSVADNAVHAGSNGLKSAMSAVAYGCDVKPVVPTVNSAIEATHDVDVKPAVHVNLTPSAPSAVIPYHAPVSTHCTELAPAAATVTSGPLMQLTSPQS